VSSGDLRASDADRAQVTEVLQAAYAEGRITLDEHAERTAAALSAKTFDDLTAITADLVPTAQPSTPEEAGPDQINTVLSGVKREGPWRVRQRSVSSNMLGSVYLDLTRATFDAAEVEINTTSFLGSMKLRVPVGTTIRDETTHVLGSTSIKDIGEPDPSGTTVVLTGTCILGSISVRGPRRALFSKDA
jgi:Domain of unknown function (DUF1707)/Cell wall-active antibiotics response 4TMS YvqF